MWHTLRHTQIHTSAKVFALYFSYCLLNLNESPIFCLTYHIYPSLFPSIFISHLVSPPVCIQCFLVDWNHLALNIAKIRKKPTFTDWQTKSWRKDIIAREGNPSPSGCIVKVFRWKLNGRKWIHDGCWDKALDIIFTWIKMVAGFSPTLSY